MFGKTRERARLSVAGAVPVARDRSAQLTSWVGLASWQEVLSHIPVDVYSNVIMAYFLLFFGGTHSRRFLRKQDIEITVHCDYLPLGSCHHNNFKEKILVIVSFLN